MRDGWEIKTLEEVVTYARGLTYSKKDEVEFSSNIVLRSNNVDLLTHTLDFTELKYIKGSIKIAEEKRVKKNSLIICTANGSKTHLGKVALIDKDYGYAFGGFMGQLMPNAEVNSKYLFYVLTSHPYKKFISELSDGANINNLKFDDLKKFSFAIPSFSEQKRIVEILDEAFAAIDKAKANVEKNLQNAKELFNAHLRALFNQDKHIDNKEEIREQGINKFQQSSDNHEAFDILKSLSSDSRTTKTGGRDATLRHVPGDLSLSVGIPNKVPKPGWRWSLLSNLAKLESGHTPSRRHPEYWGGQIPWIGIQDARDNHGRTIYDTFQHTNELGIQNSSARILPKNTVCLSRTASVGYVVVMGNPMSTSQDFVNWICGPGLIPDFLKYLLLAEAREGLYRFSTGAVHQTIYFPEAKAFCICHPQINEQKEIVLICDKILSKTKKLEAIYQKKLNDLEELKKSILQKAFAGELTAEKEKSYAM